MCIVDWTQGTDVILGGEVAKMFVKHHVKMLLSRVVGCGIPGS